MIVRIALITLALAGSMSWAAAADLGGQMPSIGHMPSTGCDCGGSNMIVIYDTQPGVVTRHWWGDCECAGVPATRPPLRVAAPLPQYEPLIEPWRR
jgi:hypothetical protein